MKQKGNTLISFSVLLLFFFGAWGWVWNIIKLAEMTFDPITGMMVLRVIGIFVAPLGAVLGFL